MKKTILFLILLMPISLAAQNVLTPEMLWSLGWVSAKAVSPDGQTLLYTVTKTDFKTEKKKSSDYFLNLSTKKAQKTDALKDKSFIQWDENGLYAKKGNTLLKSVDQGKTWTEIYTKLEGVGDLRVSPDGKVIAFSKEVQIEKVRANEIYDDVKNSSARIYTDLGYRHWDQWSEGKVNHVFVAFLDGRSAEVTDILSAKPYETPRKPFGDSEDFIFTKDSKGLIYVTKEKVGKEAMQSTNTDLFHYDIATGETENLTKGMMGYDLSPKISPDGKTLAWLSMEREGFEADKVNVFAMNLSSRAKMNLTASWDETVDGDYRWSADGKSIYFTASIKGTQQLFAVDVPANLNARIAPAVRPITSGNFNLTTIAGESKGKIITARTDFNHAPELVAVDPKKGGIEALTGVNDSAYGKIALSKTELRMVKTKDGHDMGVWVIYPPHFDPSKKYPTLLYCQGGPQSAVSQFYSLRWNFQLMAANGYIVVAPNRRGMPGWGVEWNEVISKDWGGGPMQDYLDAIDALAKEPFVDENRLGCVGASYGGYSVFFLAGIHENRFKTFIAHNGLFDMRSWYGTTEELWFANWDLGGNYWQKNRPASFEKFNPSNYVDRWNTPILIFQGERDYRVPIEQGLQAFQAAQLRGVKSKLVFFPDENHWILKAHNALVWQRAFFDWLKETL